MEVNVLITPCTVHSGECLWDAVRQSGWSFKGESPHGITSLGKAFWGTLIWFLEN